MTILDRSKVPLLLPSPTKLNTGAFKVPYGSSQDPSYIYDYSPIDIAVCGMELLLRGCTPDNQPITNLSKWFVSSPSEQRYSEHMVHIGLLINNQPVLRTVGQWRTACADSLYDEPDYLGLLKKLAPFTFR